MNTNPLKPAAFFDRDGILNETFVRDGKPYAPRTLEDFKIKPGAIEMVAKFKQAGYVTVVVTNQPDVGNGLVARQVVEAMHAQLLQAMSLDLIKVCFHAQGDGCECRKPNPGMLVESAMDLGLDLAKSIMIGDRGSDIEAGGKVGCFTFFLQCGYNESVSVTPDLVVCSLTEITPENIF